MTKHSNTYFPSLILVTLAVLVENTLSGLSADLPNIPRLGNQLVLDQAYEQVDWYGRGPHENYQDRNSSALVGGYQASVEELYFPYIRPQENGNRTEVRHVDFRNSGGKGIRFSAVNELLAFSAHHRLNSDFDEGARKIQRHTYDLPKRSLIQVNIDYQQMGVGGDNSWGAQPLDQYQIPAKEYRYNFMIERLW